MYQQRWPIAVDNFYVKQHLGLADFRVQAYEATEKWFAVVFVALAFLQWRLNHAPAGTRWRFLADVVRQHRYEHTRTLLETACQEAVRLADDVPVVQRFLSQPTYGSKKRQSPVSQLKLNGARRSRASLAIVFCRRLVHGVWLATVARNLRPHGIS
jgi:hypothetical protein